MIVELGLGLVTTLHDGAHVGVAVEVRVRVPALGILPMTLCAIADWGENTNHIVKVDSISAQQFLNGRPLCDIVLAKGFNAIEQQWKRDHGLLHGRSRRSRQYRVEMAVNERSKRRSRSGAGRTAHDSGSHEQMFGAE